MPKFVTLTLRAGKRPVHVNPEHVSAVYEVTSADEGRWTVVATTSGIHQVAETVEQALAAINPSPGRASSGPIGA